MATTPTTHAVVPCALSLLSLAMPHLPHSHKCHASLHTHTHGVLCVAPPIHSHTHTGWLTAHTPSTHHHHWVCVCSSTCSHPPHTHTHGTHRRGPCMGGCWCGHHHHAPCAPPSHTHTQRDWWCGPWWCLVVRVCPVCASHATITLAFPPTTTTNALVPPPPSHTHTGLGACTTATHTHATCTTTHTKACCVLTTPCHTHHHPLHPPIHTHTTWHTHGISHTATMVLAIAHHAVHSHTTDATHTPHRRQTKAKHTTGCGFS